VNRIETRAREPLRPYFQSANRGPLVPGLGGFMEPNLKVGDIGPLRTLTKNIEAIEQASKEFGYKALVLARPGESYTHKYYDRTGRSCFHTGPVPSGFVYVQIDVPGREDTAQFWHRVDELIGKCQDH